MDGASAVAIIQSKGKCELLAKVGEDASMLMLLWLELLLSEKFILKVLHSLDGVPF